MDYCPWQFLVSLWEQHFQGLLFYLHVGQSSSGSKFKTPTQLFWKSFKVTRVPQKETRAEAGEGERLCVTCAGERRKVPACTLCWCAFHTSLPLSPRKITEKAKNWSDWLSIGFCLKQTLIFCCVHVLHNFSALFHLYIYEFLRQHLFQIANVK